MANIQGSVTAHRLISVCSILVMFYTKFTIIITELRAHFPNLALKLDGKKWKEFEIPRYKERLSSCPRCRYLVGDYFNFGQDPHSPTNHISQLSTRQSIGRFCKTNEGTFAWSCPASGLYLSWRVMVRCPMTPLAEMSSILPILCVCQILVTCHSSPPTLQYTHCPRY